METPSSPTLSSESTTAELSDDLAILVHYLVNQRMDSRFLRVII
jgi:hypothetical protein